MGAKGKTKHNIEEIKKLYLLGNSDMKISKILNIPKSSVLYIRSVILKYPKILETISLNKDQEEVLIGTLLGDSYVGYTHKGCNYPCLTYSHCEAQEIYAKHKYNKLKNIMSSIIKRQYKKEISIKGKLCKIQPVLYARSKNCKYLIKYRELFYKNNKKIIPIEYIKDNFTAQSLAYLFMDDGNKTGKSFNLNLQGFELENLIEFRDFLFTKFNLDFTIKKDKTFYLRHKSVKIFLKLITPYLTSDMQYKINCHL